VIPLNLRTILISVLFLYCYLFPGSVYPDTQTYDEYAIKTAFLFRSLHYVEWNSKNANNKLIVICVIEPDSFSKTIQSLSQRTVSGRVIALRNLESYTDVDECDVLHIPMKSSSLLQQLLKTIENRNILTISDHLGYAKNGVILNFPLEGQKVSIEVNIDAANRQNIKFSAKLLRIANIVGNK